MIQMQQLYGWEETGGVANELGHQQRDSHVPVQ
jgi:hypothetical protein